MSKTGLQNPRKDGCAHEMTCANYEEKNVNVNSSKSSFLDKDHRLIIQDGDIETSRSSACTLLPNSTTSTYNFSNPQTTHSQPHSRSSTPLALDGLDMNNTLTDSDNTVNDELKDDVINEIFEKLNEINDNVVSSGLLTSLSDAENVSKSIVSVLPTISLALSTTIDSPNVDAVSLQTDILSSQSADPNSTFLTFQDRACLEEIERGSKLSQEEKELLEDSRKNLQEHDEQEFAFSTLGLDPDTSAIAETDLSKFPPSLGFDGMETSANVNQIDPPETVIDSVTASLLDFDAPSVSKSQPEDNKLYQDQTAKNTTTGYIVKPNQSLATVSISTMKDTSMTNIIVQTTDGQQVINLSKEQFLQMYKNAENLNQEVISNKEGYLVIPISNQQSQNTKPTLQRQSKGKPIILSKPKFEEGDRKLPGRRPESITMITPSILSSSESAEARASQVVGQPDGVGGKLWACPEEGCNEMFEKPFKLKIHIMKHTGERPYKCSYSDCDWAFVTKCKLKRHEESHSKDKLYECEVPGCHKKFSTSYNLTSHLKLHVREPNICCTENGCEAKFVTRRLMDQHVKKMHPETDKKFNCPFPGCKKIFLTENSMGSHVRVHQSQESDLTCSYCNKKFDRMCRLKQHVRSHTGEKPYVCTYPGCTWRFTTASKLTRHAQKHTGERKYVCPVEGCQKAFMRSDHLKGHMVTHQGRKPFKCDVPGCNAQFTAKSTLYVHLRKHYAMQAGDRIYFHCPMEGCMKKYTSGASLRSHISKHKDSSLMPAFSDKDIQLFHVFPPFVADSESPVIAESVVQANQIHVSSLNSAPGMVSLISGHDVRHPAVFQTFETLETKIENGVEVATTVMNKSDKTIAISTSHIEERGSARTDYQYNTLLSDLAKQRRDLVREQGPSAASSINLLDAIEKCKQDKQREATASSSSSSPVYSPSEMLTSQAITFRDPETGVTFIQTQLLQDDPPNPSLPFAADVHLQEDNPNLACDLPVLSHQNDERVAVFMGSTINMQDLA